MKRFDSCTLCLQQAREPVACEQGHICEPWPPFLPPTIKLTECRPDCKECIYSDLLSQKKDIKRFKTKLEELAREEEAEKARAAQAARERVLRDFERGQLGLASRKDQRTSGADKEKEKATGNGDEGESHDRTTLQ
jgi:nitric oxide synthase-interacting protein